MRALRSPLACLLGALLLLDPVGAVAGEPAAEIDKRLAAIRDWQVQELESLAKRALRATDGAFATRLVNEIEILRPSQAPSPLRGQVAVLEENDARVLRNRAKLDKAYARYAAGAARRLATLATWCVEQGADERGRALARGAVAHDPDQGEARRVLGESKVRGWGWVDAERAARLRKGRLPLGQEWLPRAEVLIRRRAWEHAWVVLSPHWELRSNLELERIFELRDLLEAYYRGWMDDWDGFLPMDPSPPRFRVFIFAQRSEYESYLEANDPAHVRGVPGQYSPQHRLSTFFDVETLAGSGQRLSSLREVMLHECTHQLMHEKLGCGSLRFDPADAPNFWLHEGLCEYYGMHTLRKGRLVLDVKAVRKMVRTGFLKKRLGRAPSVADLVGLTRETFQAANGETRRLNYALSGFLCVHLARNHRSGFRRLLRAAYCERNEAGLVAELIAADLAGLDRSFRHFLGTL